jgi:hypothetical protein
LIEGLGSEEPLGLILDELDVADGINVIRDDRGYLFPDFAVTKPREYDRVRRTLTGLARAELWRIRCCDTT